MHIYLYGNHINFHRRTKHPYFLFRWILQPKTTFLLLSSSSIGMNVNVIDGISSEVHLIPHHTILISLIRLV